MLARMAGARSFRGRGLSMAVLLGVILAFALGSAGVAAAVGVDDQIPGVAQTSPFSDTLDDTTDIHDVIPVNLVAGQTLVINLSGPSTEDFDLYLFSPSATDVDSDVAIEMSENEFSTESIRYSATQTGTYYIDVMAWSGAGAYTLTWSIGDATSVTISRNVAYPAYGQYITLTAVLKRSPQNTALAGKTVHFRRWNGTTWAFIGSAVTNASGVATKLTLPWGNAKTTYRSSFLAEGSYLPCTSASSAVVTPKAYLTTPIAPYSVRENTGFAVYGSLKPYHTAGTYPVRIYGYKYVSGKLVNYGYINARSYRVGTYPYYTKYSGTAYITGKGTWKLRAYHSDASHYATWSGWETVIVK